MVAGLLVCAGLGQLAAGQESGFNDLLTTKKSRRGPKAPPARISVTLDRAAGGEGLAELAITAQLPAGAFIYSMTPGRGAATRVEIEESTGLEPVGGRFIPDRPPVAEFDKALGKEVEKYFNSVTWRRQYRAAPGQQGVARLRGVVEYQVCDDRNCVSAKQPFDVSMNVGPAPKVMAPAAARNPGAPRELGGPAIAPLPESDDPATQFKHFAGRQPQRQLALTWKAGLSHRAVKPGDDVLLIVEARIEPGWHIYAFDQQKNEEGLGPAPTLMAVTDDAGLASLDPVFRGAKLQSVASEAWEGLTERFWSGPQTWSKRLKVPDNLEPGPAELAGAVAYQACREGQCLTVTGFRFRVGLAVGDAAVAEPVLALLEPLSSAEANEIIETLALREPVTESAEEPVASLAEDQPPHAANTPPLPRELDGPPPRAARNLPSRQIDAAPEPAAGPHPPAPGGPVMAAAPPQPPASLVTRGIDKSQGLGWFLLVAVAAGFAALATPCVFPMVPITVSFFQKQSEKQHHRPVTMAGVYCLGIIGTFTFLGLAMSAIWGAAAVTQLANNPWVNLFIGGILVFFGLNLLGLFEIRMPSWLLSYTAGQESRGGFLGVLFMSITFTLTSFTCTFAFAGGLLAAAAGGERLWPLMGLAAFSAAFALPFFFLALFPSLLQKLPKSGGWMNVIKVVMGLIEVGAAFKFLSVADLYWHPVAWVFDFELVMSAWIVISLAAALYLLGLFRLPHDIRGDSIGVIRFCSALSFLGLAAYLAVGLYGPNKPSGKVWENILAFAPPRFDGQTDSRLGPVLVHGGVKYALDFQRAMQAASQENKPVFLDFTGVNCTNCRKMEHGPLSNPSVSEKLKGFVCVQVYCDQVPHVSERGERARLLQQNLALQEWFGDNSLPSYAVVEADTALMSRSPDEALLSDKTGYDPDVEAFSRFLDEGINRWKQLARGNSRVVGSR